MKKVCSLFIIAALLSSCGMFKNVNKDKFEHEVVEEQKSDSTESLEERSLDKGSSIEIDKGIVETERKTTKVTETKGAKWSVSVDLLKLKNGTYITKDSAGNRVGIMLDSLSNDLVIDIDLPDQKTTETIEEKIKENKERSKEDQRDKSESSSKQVAVSTSNDRKESIEIKNVQKEGKNSFWFIVMALGIVTIVVFFIGRWFKRKF